MAVDFTFIADIGGTNARFALASDQGITDIAFYPASEHPRLVGAMAGYLDALPQDRRPGKAVIAVACPVFGDVIAFTNSPWTFDRKQLAADAGFLQLTIINDFEAQARSLALLSDADILAIGGGKAVASAPKAVLGPGTGLGVASLVPDINGGWRVIAGEGGHVTMAARTDREASVLAAIRDRQPQGPDHVSAEKVLSGFGLQNIYWALCQLDGQHWDDMSPKDISAMAASGAQSSAEEALRLFSAFLGTAASDLALTLGARGGVYIAGGIVPALGPAFDRQIFRQRFEDKGRFKDYLAPIPTNLITHPYPGLLGLSAMV